MCKTLSCHFVWSPLDSEIDLLVAWIGVSQTQIRGDLLNPLTFCFFTFAMTFLIKKVFTILKCHFKRKAVNNALLVCVKTIAV